MMAKQLSNSPDDRFVRSLRLMAVGAMMCVLGAAARADEKKDNAKLIQGKWEVIAAHEGGPPKGGTVEFTKDGKLKVSGEQNGMKMDFDGTYKVDGNKMVLTFKIGDNEQSVTITIDKLDETTCITTSEHGKVELKRKK
jgi:uncharacterized protein (TIGR03066 family)